MNRWGQVADRAKQMMAGFTIGQRAIVAVAVVALGLGAFALSRWAAQPTWAPLFANLSPQNASTIVDQLAQDGVKYQLANGGTTILVPQQQAAALRVSLAGKGLTTGNDGSGYSVLDQQGMTATDFQQNVAYQRALESELAKTLKAISGVNTAIVHLAIPKKDVFTQETDRPTASVLIALAPGTALGRAQIRSVMHLVAGSVPGLDPSDVTVTDADGNMLSMREDGQSGAVGAASEADRQTQAFEDAKSAALQRMLDQVLGKGMAVVRVNAELNYDATDTTSETYVTQSGLSPVSRATSSESYANVAGAAGNLGQTYPSLTPGLGVGNGGTYVKIEETVNNPVGKVVSRTQAAPGGIRKLSVAIMYDSKLKITQSQLEELATQAVGLDTQGRGDTVTAQAVEFDSTAAQAAAEELKKAAAAARTAQYLDLGKKAGIGLALVIVALVVMRRRRKQATEEQARVEAIASDLPQPILHAQTDEQLAIASAAHDAIDAREAHEADVLDASLERELLRDEVAKFVDQQPEEIAAIVQGWLGQRKH